MPEIEANGTRFYYQQSGEGRMWCLCMLSGQTDVGVQRAGRASQSTSASLTIFEGTAAAPGHRVHVCGDGRRFRHLPRRWA